MLFLGLILSCTLKNIISKEKGRRKDISDAISKSGDAGVSVLKEVRQIDALKENDEGLLPVEEAIEIKNLEATKILIRLNYFEYSHRVYGKIVDTGDISMFNLIPKGALDHRLLMKIKLNRDILLEQEFLNIVEATELERLILKGKFREVKSKGKRWIDQNYRYQKNLESGDDDRAITTSDIVCLYGEDLIGVIIEKLEGENQNIRKDLMLSASKLGKAEAVEYLLRDGLDFSMAVDG